MGDSTPSSHATQGPRDPEETPGPHGAHLATTKANHKEEQIGTACNALVPGFGLGFRFVPGSSPLHTSLVLPSSPRWELLLLQLLLQVSLPSPVTVSKALVRM